MKKCLSGITGFVFLLLICNACNKDKLALDNLYVPSASDVTATATLDELQHGRSLYINSCGTCHNIPSPDSYSVNDWHSILSGMVPKTNLSTANATLVSKYVTRGTP
jgi:cytochrome c5